MLVNAEDGERDDYDFPKDTTQAARSRPDNDSLVIASGRFTQRPVWWTTKKKKYAPVGYASEVCKRERDVLLGDNRIDRGTVFILESFDIGMGSEPASSAPVTRRDRLGRSADMARDKIALYTSVSNCIEKIAQVWTKDAWQ